MNISNPREVMKWALTTYREAKEVFGTPNNLSESRETFNKTFDHPLRDSEEAALDALGLSLPDESFLHYDKDDPTASLPYAAQLREGLLYDHIVKANQAAFSLESQVFNKELLRSHAEFLRFTHKETYTKGGL